MESARLVERETEDALRGLRHAQIRSKRTDVKTHRRGYREATVEKKLKFGSAESMEGVKNAETVKKAEQKRHFYNRFFQKKRYKDAYRAARAGKSADSLGGATTIAGVENMTVKAKDHVFEKADRFTERQKEKEAQAAKTEKAGKEQPDQKPKTKKHDMEL